MTSWELDCLHSFINSTSNTNDDRIVRVEDYNGHWLITLSNGSTIKLHYEIVFSEESKVREADENYWAASDEADASLVVHVNRRL